MTPPTPDRPLLLLDTASLYFRAFYGVPESVRAADGSPVNAVRGLLDMTARLVAARRPARLVACWDDDWRPAFRVAAIPSYKAHRLAADGPDGAEDVPPALAPLVLRMKSAAPDIVIEACEYDRSFLNLHPQVGVMLNIEQDHLDYYANEAEIVEGSGWSERIRHFAPNELSRGLARADSREEIADLVIAYLADRFERAAIFLIRGDTAIGWKGVLHREPLPEIADIRIPLGEPSVLKAVVDGSGLYLGPLADTPMNAKILEGMGGGRPSSKRFTADCI